MAETKINLNYQVKTDQFEDKVGDAITTGNAVDEVEDKIDERFNDTDVGGGVYEGGHTHSGTLLDGQKVSYNNLTNVPSTFTPSAHTHPFGELTGDIAFSQLDAIISTSNEANKIIEANDARLSDARTPTSHTHTFSDLTDDIAFSQLDALITTGSESNKIIEATDARLSDARTPTSHNNTRHTETYITSSGVTFENLDANGDVGTAATQVAVGNHAHSSIYYTQTTIDNLLDGKSDITHTHSNEEVLDGGLAPTATFGTPLSRSYAYSPFGVGGWTINSDGTASIVADGTGDKSMMIDLPQIPDGSVLTFFILFVYADNTHNLDIKLYRTSFVDGVAEEIASMTHTDDTTIGTGSSFEGQDAGVGSTSGIDFVTGTTLIDKVNYHYWMRINETDTNNANVKVSGGWLDCDVDIPAP